MFKTNNILIEQICIDPLATEGLCHTHFNMFHTRAYKSSQISNFSFNYSCSKTSKQLFKDLKEVSDLDEFIGGGNRIGKCNEC